MLTLLVPGVGMGGGGAAAAPAFQAGRVPTWRAEDPGITWRAEDPGVTWKARGETDVTVTRLEKRAGWSRNFNFDFGDFAEAVAGQTLSSPSVSFTPSGLTVGTPAVSGDEVQVRLSGGTAGVLYTGECSIATSGGDTITQQGELQVVE